MNSLLTWGAWALVAGIIGGAFVSEDGATVTAAALAASQILDARLAFLSAFAGLWVGDLGVYALARRMGPAILSHRWFARRIRATEPPSPNKRAWSLAISRFFPGTRLPMYVSAGLSRMPPATFAAITAISALLWTLLVFLLIRLAPSRAGDVQRELRWLGSAGLALFGLLTLWRVRGAQLRVAVRRAAERVMRWEFWPAWLFYAPVAMMCAWLGVRYRGFSLPTIANVNQKNGGIVGESKIEILRELQAAVPHLTAEAFLLESGPLEARTARVREICTRHGINAPFVLKPDTGQRGAGFRKISSLDQVEPYLAQVSSPVVVQRYVAGPQEAGIFYYRFPGEARGRILGITRKEFPIATGDGVHTLRELIERDVRARFAAKTYLRRFPQDADRILAEGEGFRLVEAGNHCQGCEFKDGSDLHTEALLAAFDEISRKLPGFYVGRFDIRYESDEELRQGRGFQIIELNGAASEATNIYDSRNSLWSAYRTLYQQWKIVYAIGAANRDRGFQPASAYNVWRDWKEFSRRACEFPVAD
jgi:membrane protein DedA with SNARE-associated domain